MGVGQLGDNLNQYKDKGPADLKMSAEARDKYLSIINDYKEAIETQRKKISGLPLVGNVGTLNSAAQIKTMLGNDVTGSDGLIKQLQQYEDYLDIAAATVKKAADRFLTDG